MATSRHLHRKRRSFFCIIVLATISICFYSFRQALAAIMDGKRVMRHVVIEGPPPSRVSRVLIDGVLLADDVANTMGHTLNDIVDRTRAHTIDIASKGLGSDARKLTKKSMEGPLLALARRRVIDSDKNGKDGKSSSSLLPFGSFGFGSLFLSGIIIGAKFDGIQSQVQTKAIPLIESAALKLQESDIGQKLSGMADLARSRIDKFGTNIRGVQAGAVNSTHEFAWVREMAMHGSATPSKLEVVWRRLRGRAFPRQ